MRRKAHETLGLPHTRFYRYHEENPAISLTELDRLNGKTHLFMKNEPGYGTPLTSMSVGGTLDTRSRATSVTISDTTDGHVHPPAPFHILLPDEMHPTLAQDYREFSVRCKSSHSSTSISTSAIASTSASVSTSVPAPPPTSRPMSFYDDPSEYAMEMDTLPTALPFPTVVPHTPPAPKPTTNPRQRKTPPKPEYLPHQQPFHGHPGGPNLNPRIDPPPQMQYFHSSLQQEPLSFLSLGPGGGGGVQRGNSATVSGGSGIGASSNSVGAGFQQVPSGFHTPNTGFTTSGALGGTLPNGFGYYQSSYGGWGTGGGGFGMGNSPIVLDASWNSLVEQLGFAIG
jgi:hypothetical protein